MKPITKICTLLLLTLLSASTAGFAQTAYNDAVALKKLLVDHKWQVGTKDQVGAILANYCAKDDVESLFFNNNPFTMDYGTDLRSHSGFTGDQNPIAAAVGGFDVTNIANGLALFLIDRAKGEINEAFFVRLNDFLAKYPEFATLFPNTQAFISKLNSWEYANFLNTLKDAFNKDIKSLPADLIALKDVDCSASLSGSPQTDCDKRLRAIRTFLASKEGRLLLSASKIGDGFIKGEKLPEIFGPVIDTAYLLNTTVGLSGNAQNDLKLLNIVNQSLQSNETGRSYITPTEFALLSTDEDLRNLYLGLIWQQMQIANLQFTYGNPAVTITVTTDVFTKDRIDGILNYIKNIYNQTKDLQIAFDNLKTHKLDSKADLSADYTALAESAQQILKSLRATNIIDSRLTIPKEADVFFDQAGAMLQIAGQLFNNNYSAAMRSTLSLINAAVQKYDPRSSQPELVTFCQDLVKYASFAANFVEAKTPEDAKSAIEAVALPSGSYSIKQKSDWNISLNGYAGYTFDIDYANGLYAPVGFSFSHGSRKTNGWNVTIFTGLIDVGSLVSYNLQSGDTGAQKQEIRLESIFSPSAQFLLGIGRTPISFGGGYRRTPKLFYSKIDGTFNPVPAKGVVSLSILIDIPIFTLHNTPFR